MEADTIKEGGRATHPHVDKQQLSSASVYEQLPAGIQQELWNPPTPSLVAFGTKNSSHHNKGQHRVQMAKPLNTFSAKLYGSHYQKSQQ